MSVMLLLVGQWKFVLFNGNCFEKSWALADPRRLIPDSAVDFCSINVKHSAMVRQIGRFNGVHNLSLSA
jgi:hypothetical protein